MPLPILTTVEDVDIVTTYLKTKPTGASLKEAKAVIAEKYLDGRKLRALESWNLITAGDGRINLTERGRAYARAAAEEKGRILRQVLYEVNPYRTALEWAHHQSLDSVSTSDVAARWYEHSRDEVGTESDTTLALSAVCMFHVCQASGLGSLTIGRRGKPTRLDLNREALRAFVEGSDLVARLPFSEPKAAPLYLAAGEPVPALPAKLDVPRVFVSHGKNSKILEQIKKTLEFGGFECVVAKEEETTAVPVPEKIMDAMHRCNAAIINISADEEVTDPKGKKAFRINDNVLIEVGVAFVLYKKRVILLVDRRVMLPSNLQGLYRCEYEGAALDWETGMKLQETLTKFREGLVVAT